jgi:hypothetical protein
MSSFTDQCTRGSNKFLVDRRVPWRRKDHQAVILLHACAFDPKVTWAMPIIINLLFLMLMSNRMSIRSSTCTCPVSAQLSSRRGLVSSLAFTTATGYRTFVILSNLPLLPGMSFSQHLFLRMFTTNRNPLDVSARIGDHAMTCY